MVKNAFQNYLCVVTGGSRGIGRELVRELAYQGAHVVFCGRDPVAVDETVSICNGMNVNGFVVELRDQDQVGAFAKTVLSFDKKISILINNAAVMNLGPMDEVPFSEWDDMIRTNLSAPLQLISEFLPCMIARKTGTILNITSIAGRSVGPGTVVYGATKAALDIITEGLRREMAAKGLRIMGLQLGAVATSLNDKIPHVGMRRLIKARTAGYQPLKIDLVIQTILQMLLMSNESILASAFLVPTDQAS